MKVQQNSKIGNANAAIKIGLLNVEEKKTEVSFDGDVKLSGLLASMGQRLIGGVANTLSKQFFSNLEKELEKVNVIVGFLNLQRHKDTEINVTER